MAYTLIEATTSAVATKAGFAVRKVPATLYATGLATTEECDIFISPDDGDSWETVISTDSGGATDERTLTATQMAFLITAPMYIGVTKDSTASAAGVYLSDTNNP